MPGSRPEEAVGGCGGEFKHTGEIVLYNVCWCNFFTKLSRRSRARTRLIEEDAETEASYGSLENSGTESSLHGDESSNLGMSRLFVINSSFWTF